MAKRFGRNKRKLLIESIERIKTLEKELKSRNEYVKQLERFKPVSTDIMTLYIQPEYQVDICGDKINDNERMHLTHIDLDVRPLMFQKHLTLRNLQMIKYRPENFSSEISNAFREELIKALPAILVNVPDIM